MPKDNATFVGLLPPAKPCTLSLEQVDQQVKMNHQLYLQHLATEPTFMLSGCHETPVTKFIYLAASLHWEMPEFPLGAQLIASVPVHLPGELPKNEMEYQEMRNRSLVWRRPPLSTFKRSAARSSPSA